MLIKMRILFFTDVNGFGGHEVTLLDAIAGLCASDAEYTGVMYCEGNKTLEDKLKSVQALYGKLDLIPVPYTSERGELIKGLFSSAKVRNITVRMKKVAPDVVVVSQPAIGMSVCGLTAAKKCGARVISFVPSLSSACSSYGVSMGNMLYDFLLKYVYKLPGRFITIADHVRDELVRCHGVPSCNVDTVKYGVNPDAVKKIEKVEARRSLGWKDCYSVITVGRIAFKEKGHDLLIESISRHMKEVSDVKFYIVGSGPDENRAVEMVKEARLQDKVRFVPWQEDLSLVYSAADMLIMPSRIEGAPLVMLGALVYGLDCIGSNIPGIKEILPDKFIFRKDDPESLAERFKSVRRDSCSDEMKSLGDSVLSNRKISQFRSRFAEVVVGAGAEK